MERPYKSYIKASNITRPTWKKEFGQPNGTFSISDIQDYFEYTIKKASYDLQYKNTPTKFRTELLLKEINHIIFILTLAKSYLGAEQIALK